MKVKIKKLHPDAVIPTYSKEGDAGMDLTTIDNGIFNNESFCWEYGTGLSFEIPKGYVGLMFPRSSIFRKDLSLSNSVGVIDSGYRGEIKFKFRETYFENQQCSLIYSKGDRIGQLIILPYPNIEFEEVDELTDTDRGTGGFGSTDPNVYQGSP